MKSILLCLPLALALGCSQERGTHAADKQTSPSATTTKPQTSTTTTTTTPKYGGTTTEASAAKPADNTGINERDRDGETLTPPDQAENEADLALTQEVRQALVADDALSFNAKNIKVISQNGKVTLRGPVASAEEKQNVEAKVRAVAGVSEVDSQLEVKTD